MPASPIKRQTVFWSCDSEPWLQLADYGLWSVMREKETGDPRARHAIKNNVRHVYDLFAVGRTHYYGPHAKKP